MLNPLHSEEKRYREILQEPLRKAQQMGGVDIVVGIPFYNEAETIVHVVETAIEGLNRFYPGLRSMIVAAGSPAGGEALEAINAIPSSGIGRTAFLLDDARLDGKGWAIRAIMEIADKLGADLALLEADLTSRTNDDGEVEGLTPQWLQSLLEPIRSWDMDLVISRFNLHYLDGQVCINLVYPLLAAFYNCPIHCLLGGQWGISHGLLRTYLQEPRHAWGPEIGGYGINSWLATTAITSGARICETNLGVKIRRI